MPASELDEGDLASGASVPEAPSAVTLTLWIVRHGITAWNAEGRLQGQTDVPLSDEGRAQARLLNQRFIRAASSGIRPSQLSVHPDYVYASDLCRASETAAITMRGLEIPPARFRVTERLRERAFGPWEGLTLEEAKSHFGETRSYRDEGETKEAVWARMHLALREMWDNSTNHGTRDGCVLVVGHGGSLRELATGAIGLPIEAARHFHLDNTGLSMLELKGTSFDQRTGRIFLWNDTAHLEQQSANV